MGLVISVKNVEKSSPIMRPLELMENALNADVSIGIIAIKRGDSMHCDDCKFYRWYYDHCDKWNCKTDERSFCNAFEEMNKPILKFMLSQQGRIKIEKGD